MVSGPGGWLVVKQNKTKARVELQVSGALAALLTRIPRRAVRVLTSSDEAPWTPDGFRSSWGRARTKAAIVGLTFNEFRGTAMANLVEAGCTVPEIASITGHSLKAVNTILERYWTRTRTQAAHAVTKMEAFRAKSGK